MAVNYCNKKFYDIGIWYDWAVNEAPEEVVID
jgi:hypothetical protein